MNKPRNLIIIAIVLVVLIAGGSLAAIIWSNYQASHTNNANGSTTNANNAQATTPQAAAQATADNAEKLSANGNLQAGVAELNTAIKNTTDTSQQYIYYSQLATILLNNNELASALDAGKKAYSLNQTSGSAALVGQIAVQMGDKQTAIEYYTNAINHIDQSDMYAQEDKAYYQGIITNLQGGK